METAPLVRALKLAALSLLAYDFIEVNTHFCFSEDELYAYDSRTAIFVEHKTGLSCALRGKVLLDMLESAGAEVELEQDGEEVVLKDGKSEVKMPTIASEQFTFKNRDALKKSKALAQVNITEDFIDALELCLLGANQDAYRPELTGVTLHILEGKEVRLYTTNNFTVTMYTMPCVAEKKVGRTKAEPRPLGEAWTILPKQSADLMVKTYRALKDTLKSCTLYVSADLVYMQLTGEVSVTVASHPVAVEHADYPSIMKKFLGKLERFNFDKPEEFESAIARAEVLQGKELQKRCGVSVKGADMRVWTRGMYGTLDTKVKLSEKITAEHFEIPPDHTRRILPFVEEVGLGKSCIVFYGHEGKLLYLVEHYSENQLEE